MSFEALALFPGRVKEINIFKAQQYRLSLWKFRSVPEIPQDFAFIFAGAIIRNENFSYV